MTSLSSCASMPSSTPSSSSDSQASASGSSAPSSSKSTSSISSARSSAEGEGQGAAGGLPGSALPGRLWARRDGAAGDARCRRGHETQSWETAGERGATRGQAAGRGYAPAGPGTGVGPQRSRCPGGRPETPQAPPGARRRVPRLTRPGWAQLHHLDDLLVAVQVQRPRALPGLHADPPCRRRRFRRAPRPGQSPPAPANHGPSPSVDPALSASGAGRPRPARCTLGDVVFCARTVRHRPPTVPVRRDCSSRHAAELPHTGTMAAARGGLRGNGRREQGETLGRGERDRPATTRTARSRGLGHTRPQTRPRPAPLGRGRRAAPPLRLAPPRPAQAPPSSAPWRKGRGYGGGLGWGSGWAGKRAGVRAGTGASGSPG